MRGNCADEIQRVMSMACMQNPFVRDVKIIDNNMPAIILYSDEMIADIRRHCLKTSELKSILGVDRTFNLSRAFVTPMVYRHPDFVWKSKGIDRTGHHPTFLGTT